MLLIDHFPNFENLFVASQVSDLQSELEMLKGEVQVLKNRNKNMHAINEEYKKDAMTLIKEKGIY